MALGDRGWFYAVQLDPEFKPSLMKFGFSSKVPVRLKQHRKRYPRAVLRAVWPCFQMFEYAGLGCVRHSGGRPVSKEVFEVDEPVAVFEAMSRTHVVIGHLRLKDFAHPRFR